MDYKIRAIEEHDINQVFEQLYKLAKFGNSLDYFKLTKERMKEDLFGDKPDWNGLVAVNNDFILGSCMYSFAKIGRVYSYTKKSIFIDSIYVRSDARNTKISTKFMNRILTIARTKKVGKIELYCNNDNSAAKALYKKIGMIDYDHFNVHRIMVERT